MHQAHCHLLLCSLNDAEVDFSGDLAEPQPFGRPNSRVVRSDWVRDQLHLDSKKMNIEHFRTIKNLIDDAQQNGRSFRSDILGGFSGDALIGALQRMSKYQEDRNGGSYLEIGVFQGLTLLSVAAVLKKTSAMGIDNFAYLDPGNKNFNIIEERARALSLKNYRLFNADYEDALENLRSQIGDEKIGTYFVDGPHDYRSQLVCLQLAKPFLADYSIIVVDDSNYRHVRLANRDFLLANPEFKLLYESYTPCHPVNMSAAIESAARKGWWNGVNIIVHDPAGLLERMLPDTLRDRHLFENEHVTQCLKYGFVAPELLFCVQSALSLRPIRAARQFAKLLKKLWNANPDLVGYYQSTNTFSDKLPKVHFNRSVG